MAKGKGQGPRERFRIGPDLYVTTVTIAELREQDVNAQVMQPRHFERLAENIKHRGGLESLPYCVAPETRLLTGDLHWEPAGKVAVGDVLMGFDEEMPYPAHRRWRSAVVEEVRAITRPSWKLEFDDGTVVTCSEEHQWLAHRRGGRRWVPTGALPDNAKIVRLLDTWEEDPSRDAGYLAAAFDGEGHFSQRAAVEKNVFGDATTITLGFAQNDNPMLAEVRRCLTALGFDYGKKSRAENDNAHRLFITGRGEQIRFLGQVRPPRLLSKFDPDMLGVAYMPRFSTVVRRTFVGTQTVMAIRTSTGTYVAEGLASHNCHQPGGEGPVEIISGHHRMRAARAAGMTEIPIILDVRPMRRSEIVAKQIAHNELSGTPDSDVLAQLIAMIDNVDDLLMTGLDESQLPSVDADDTRLAIPSGEFDWRMATLLFLPHQMEDFQEAISHIDTATDLVGVAGVEQFEAFASGVHEYGRVINVRNFTTIVALLTDLARREVARMQDERAEQGDAEDLELQPAG